MFKLKSRSHQADSFFVMLLFFLFALTAFILVLIGVKQYKSTANAMNYNYEVRTVTSYLREKVRQNDSDAAISVETINGTKALCLIFYLFSYCHLAADVFHASTEQSVSLQRSCQTISCQCLEVFHFFGGDFSLCNL